MRLCECVYVLDVLFGYAVLEIRTDFSKVLLGLTMRVIDFDSAFVPFFEVIPTLDRSTTDLPVVLFYQ